MYHKPTTQKVKYYFFIIIIIYRALTQNSTSQLVDYRGSS